MILKKWGSCLWILEPGFWIYAWLDTSSWPKLPKFSLQAPGPNKVNKFSYISKFYWIHLDSSGFYDSWKSEVLLANIGARGSGLVWIPLLDRAKLLKCSSYRPQATRSIIFLRFHKFTEFSTWFLRKCGLLCENWRQGSGLVDVFWAHQPSSPNVYSFSVTGPKVNKFFEISWF